MLIYLIFDRSQAEKSLQSPQKPKIIGPSMPSLVPYQDDPSSDDDEQKVAKKPESKILSLQPGPSKVVESPKVAPKPLESPKKPMVNGNHSSETTPNENSSQKSVNGVHPSPKVEFSVKSTTSSWNVSTAEQTTKLPPNNSNWVVTVASKAAKSKSLENGHTKEKESLKRK
jgi:hypothetical protein